MKNPAVLFAVCCVATCWPVLAVDTDGPVGPPTLVRPPASDEPDAAVAVKIQAAAGQAQLVFVAAVTRVKDLGETASVPPSLLMDVTVKDRQLLKGPDPDTLGLPANFSYSAVKGQGFIPAVGKKVLVMGNAALAAPIFGGPPTLPGQQRPIKTKLNILLLLEATEQNVALARRTVGPRDPKERLQAAVRAAELVFTATVDKLVMFGAIQPPIQQVTVKGVVMLKGEKPTRLDCRYPRIPDLPLNPTLGQKILCAAHPAPKEVVLPPGSVSGAHTGPLPMLGGNGPEIVFMVEATDENVALARKALEPPASRPAE